MNTQSSFYRLAIPIYAFIIAIFHFGIIMPSINLGFQHPYLRAVANSDLIIAAVLIVAAIGVIRKTRWAGSLNNRCCPHRRRDWRDQENPVGRKSLYIFDGYDCAGTDQDVF